MFDFDSSDNSGGPEMTNSIVEMLAIIKSAPFRHTHVISVVLPLNVKFSLFTPRVRQWIVGKTERGLKLKAKRGSKMGGGGVGLRRWRPHPFSSA